jgi:hypothetical protein
MRIAIALVRKDHNGQSFIQISRYAFLGVLSRRITSYSITCPLCQRTLPAVTCVAPFGGNYLPHDPFLQLARPLLCYAGKDRRQLLTETHMNTLSTKLTAFAAALMVNGLLMGAVGFLFELQSHPHMSVISFAQRIATHQWFS